MNEDKLKELLFDKKIIHGLSKAFTFHSIKGEMDKAHEYMDHLKKIKKLQKESENEN